VVIPEYNLRGVPVDFSRPITPTLILGAFAERVKFSAVLLFIVLWWTFAYLPIAHMVWYWAGRMLTPTPEAGAKAAATAGFLFQKGRFDLPAGQWCISIPASRGLIGCLLIGKRLGYGRESLKPHSVT